MNIILHIITIKLSSTNYLLWKNHMTPLFAYQKLSGHLDGTLTQPPPTIISDHKIVPNPALSSWQENDQRVILIFNASLTEESSAEVLGLTNARDIWLALENAYSNSSVERIHSLHNMLRQINKWTTSVSDFGRRFKTLCDKLAAIGNPVADIDKVHWFLCGLGASFETFL